MRDICHKIALQLQGVLHFLIGILQTPSMELNVLASWPTSSEWTGVIDATGEVAFLTDFLRGLREAVNRAKGDPGKDPADSEGDENDNRARDDQGSRQRLECADQVRSENART